MKVNIVVMKRVMRHTIGYAAFTLLTAMQVQAQHYNGWLRITAQTDLSAKWRNDAEVQARRQGMGSNMNVLQYSASYSFRDWVYYNGIRHWRFGVAPVGIFGAYKVALVPGDEQVPVKKEYRVSAMAEYDRVVYNKWKASARYAAESRWFEDGTNGLRQRIRPGIRLDRGKAAGLSAYYELLVNTVAAPNTATIDQHRAMLSGLFALGRYNRAELGLMYVRRYAGAAVGYVNEGNIVLNISFRAGGKQQ